MEPQFNGKMKMGVFHQMNLDDLEAQIELKEELTETKVEEVTDEDLDEYEESTEAELNNALSLLEDCHKMIEDVLRTKTYGNLSPHLYKKLDELGMEVIAFILQYDLEPDQLNKDWKSEL